MTVFFFNLPTLHWVIFSRHDTPLPTAGHGIAALPPRPPPVGHCARDGRRTVLVGDRLPKIGSSTSIAAVMQTRSRKVEMPSGRSLPLAFGMNTLLMGSGR